MLYLHLCNKPRFIYVEKHSKRVSWSIRSFPLCVLIIKCLFRLLPKTTRVCIRREKYVCWKKMYLYNFEGKPFNKSVHGRLLSSVVFILSYTYLTTSYRSNWILSMPVCCFYTDRPYHQWISWINAYLESMHMRINDDLLFIFSVLGLKVGNGLLPLLLPQIPASPSLLKEIFLQN